VLQVASRTSTNYPYWQGRGGTKTKPLSLKSFHTEMNLYYYRARYCDTSSGRFISEDPDVSPNATSVFV
jgi:RHS repeat-associated protein